MGGGEQMLIFSYLFYLHLARVMCSCGAGASVLYVLYIRYGLDPALLQNKAILFRTGTHLVSGQHALIRKGHCLCYLFKLKILDFSLFTYRD